MNINWSTYKEHKIVDGLYGKFFHMRSMTIARWRFESDTVLPTHNHPHEQITVVQKGSLELKVGDQTLILKENDTLTIDSDIPHGGKALEDTIALDIFSPVREDFKEKYG